MAALYGCVVFLSAFLLFLIQPVFAKLILPWFGGSAAVWTVCLVFFQTVLLGGYVYAHVLTRWLRPRGQALLHTALLAAAACSLPAMPGDRWKPVGGDDPAWRILTVLTAVLGLPYFLLGATSPLVQRWYARAAADARPYRLFALSNVAALAALMAYPFWIEPRVATRTQDWWWSGGFVAFAILCAAAAWTQRPETREVATEAAPAMGRRLAWIALAAGGSAMLLAITNQLTENVAAVPFLWILPLALYLATFILCFEGRRFYQRGPVLRLMAVALGSAGYAIYDIQVSEAILVAGPVFLGTLFVCCFFCHGELSRLTPEAGNLTAFYITIALGGALGAVFVGLVAPAVFSGVYELPFTLAYVAGLALWATWRDGWSQRMLWTVAAAAMALVFAMQVNGYRKGSTIQMRSFYGALRVVRTTRLGAEVRTLFHGTVQHGSQYFAQGQRMVPTSYYGLNSGVGLALRSFEGAPKRVGVIGLGAGTLAAFGRSGDDFHFYEINPQVWALAGSYFSYLRETRARTEVTLGDGRLALEGERAPAFDVLVVDAFSGDAIPVHLLTREAFALYFRHLTAKGILAVHVSNQYLDLAPVAGQLAALDGWRAVLVHTPKEDDRLESAADWVLITRDEEFLQTPEVALASREIPEKTGLRPWTDDYNNLFEVLRPVLRMEGKR